MKRGILKQMILRRKLFWTICFEKDGSKKSSADVCAVVPPVFSGCDRQRWTRG